MLILQEENRLKGSRAQEFQTRILKFWDALGNYGASPGWYFEVSHGTGPSYRSITGILLPDLDAWEAVSRAATFGELVPLVEELDECRHDSMATLFEVLADTATQGKKGAEVESTNGALWVMRVSSAANAQTHIGVQEMTKGARPGVPPHVIMRSVMGGARTGSLVVLVEQTPEEVLGILTSKSTGAGFSDFGDLLQGRQARWVLRPSPWSPLGGGGIS